MERPMRCHLQFDSWQRRHVILGQCSTGSQAAFLVFDLIRGKIHA
jgi:hypothetical protein